MCKQITIEMIKLQTKTFEKLTHGCISCTHTSLTSTEMCQFYPLHVDIPVFASRLCEPR